MALVIIGIVSAIAVPSLMGGKAAAQKTSAVLNLRSMHSTQIAYHTRRGRFARLAELNAFANNSFGTTSGTTLVQQEWLYLMAPTPSDDSLAGRYQTFAYKMSGGRIVTAYVIAQDGELRTIIP